MASLICKGEREQFNSWPCYILNIWFRFFFTPEACFFCIGGHRRDEKSSYHLSGMVPQLQKRWLFTWKTRRTMKQSVKRRLCLCCSISTKGLIVLALTLPESFIYFLRKRAVFEGPKPWNTKCGKSQRRCAGFTGISALAAMLASVRLYDSLIFRID